jgi:regulator of protease activity HflC (stomatin/prohibitin superfamily)
MMMRRNLRQVSSLQTVSQLTQQHSVRQFSINSTS